ncbi:hypothetical protein R3I93_011439 [Phoxinus phoxinus]|uniref:Uncharacterized protein n=1 Tax=Phoxinus phoxinus TaxID=58324 RepID=A0AAN9CWG1_9TELE
MEQTVMGVYVIENEGSCAGDDPEDIGVLVEGVEVLGKLQNFGDACALLFGLMHYLNLSYPPDLKVCLLVFTRTLLVQWTRTVKR